MSRVILSDEAADDIIAIMAFIAQDSIKYALAVESNFQDAFDRLAHSPYMGRGLRHPKDHFRLFNGTRRISDYLIVYRVIESGILVLQVMHGAQNFPSVLRIPEDES